jgi:sensor domain CHASE-containing protein
MGPSLDVSLGVLVHTLAMLAVMALVAWVVYKKIWTADSAQSLDQL